MNFFKLKRCGWANVYDDRLPPGCENFVVESGNPRGLHTGMINIPADSKVDLISCVSGFAAEGKKMLLGIPKEMSWLWDTICSQFSCQRNGARYVNPQSKTKLPMLTVVASTNRKEKKGPEENKCPWFQTILQLRNPLCKKPEASSDEQYCTKHNGIKSCSQ